MPVVVSNMLIIVFHQSAACLVGCLGVGVGVGVVFVAPLHPTGTTIWATWRLMRHSTEATIQGLGCPISKGWHTTPAMLVRAMNYL